MHDVGDDARAIDGCEEGHGAPCKGVLVTRNANDAQMRCQREIFALTYFEPNSYAYVIIKHVPPNCPPKELCPFLLDS